MRPYIDKQSITELPLPPGPAKPAEMEIYARFMRHLRHVPSEQMDIKVLSAIQFTADLLDLKDDLVSKVLVDLGLRIKRSAFPKAYLDFADQSLMRKGWELGGPVASTIQINRFWEAIGESRFADKPVAALEPVFSDGEGEGDYVGY